MTTATFRETVALVAARAKALLPAAVNGRVESAVKLVLGHDVTPQEDGSIAVGSSSDPLKVYHLVGTACECQDFVHGRAPEGWCQHRIAAGIQKRVTQVLATPPVPVEPDQAPEPWPDNDPEEPVPVAPPPLPEAPASANVRLTIAGREVQLTLRGISEAEVLTRLEAVLQRYPVPQAPAPPAISQREGWCSLHNVPMKLNHGKDGKPDWFSHRTRELTWCKGK